jgi:hypothetical protein
MNEKSKKPNQIIDFNQLIQNVKSPNSKNKVVNYQDIVPIVYSKFETAKSCVVSHGSPKKS